MGLDRHPTSKVARSRSSARRYEVRYDSARLPSGVAQFARRDLGGRRGVVDFDPARTIANCSFVSARSQSVPASERESGRPDANSTNRTRPSADFVACAMLRAIFS